MFVRPTGLGRGPSGAGALPHLWQEFHFVHRAALRWPDEQSGIPATCFERAPKEQSAIPATCSGGPHVLGGTCSGGAASSGGAPSGPVSRVLSLKTAIYLGAPSPAPSSGQPGRGPGQPIASLFALAAGGVCQAAPSPGRWCALTAPFQLFSASAGSLLFCGTFRRVAPPGCWPAPCPAQPGLSSARHKTAPRPSGPLDAGGL